MVTLLLREAKLVLTSTLPPPPTHTPNAQVKRDAVAGLASLAKSDANKEVMGKMGALAALIELVFKDDKNPTAFVTDQPKGRASTTTRWGGAS